MTVKKTIKSRLSKFFKENEGEVFSLSEINQEFSKIYPGESLYINREVRAIAKRGYMEDIKGYIHKPKRGQYKFIKGKVPSVKKSPFSDNLKKKILKKENFQCSWCGCKETKDNLLQIDHLIPEDKGGKGVLENGAVFCTRCNITKSNLDITSFGRKVYEKYLSISVKNNDSHSKEFIEELLQVFDKHGKH